MGLLDGYLDDQQKTADQTKAVMDIAVKKNPEQFAAAKKNASILGVDVGFVERNPKDAERIVNQRLIDLDALRVESPKTHSWLSGYDDAVLAQNDIPHLSALEHIGNAFKASGHRLKGGLENDEAFVFNLQSMINQGYRGLGGSLPADHFKTLANDAQQAAHHDNAIADAIAKSRSGLSRVPRVALSGLESIPGTAIALLTGLLTRSPTLGLATFGLPVFGNANQKALDQGLDPVSAAGHGTRQALLETVSESLGFAPLMKLAKGKDGFVKLATEFLGKEMFGEQINTLGSDFEEWVTLPANAGKSFADYAAEIIPHAIDTAIATVAGGGATALTVGGIGKLAKQVRQRSARAVHDKVNDSISAIEGKANIEAMAEAVSKTELNNISPEDMRRFIQHVAPDETVSLSAEDAATFFQSNPEAADALKEHAPEVYAQLAVSEATGSDVKIPMEDYLTSLQEWTGFLNDHIKVGDGAMSYAEYEKSSESLMADINAESERAIKDAGSDFNVSAQKVRVNFAQSLTDTGRFTPDVVEKYTELMSSITSSLAARTGMTPEAFAEKYKLLAQTPDRQVQQAQKQADQIDHAIYAIRSGNIPTDSQINGQSLLDFLRERGGLQDSGGELAARDLKGANKAFQKKLVSSKGNTLDRAAELAQEAGFIPERDINDLLDGIDSEMLGTPIYANANFNQDMEDQSRTIGDVQQRLHDLGIGDISKMSNAEVRDALGADYNQGAQSPVAVLSGDELNGVNEDAVKAASMYYRENLQGKTVKTAAGDVLFTGKGGKKIRNKAHFDKRAAQLLPAVESILENGVYEGREGLHKKRSDNVVAFHKFRGNVYLDGELLSVRVDILEDIHGNKFYSIEEIEKATEISRSVAPDRGDSSDSIRHDDGLFNQRAPDHRILDVSALPDSMNEVANHTSLAALQGKKGSKEHSEYLAAKNDGDVAAALNVVDRVLKPAVIENIRKQLDPNKPIYVVPVIQREGESLNMIPTAFSERLATALGASVFDSIVKTTGGKNTGKTQADRLMDKHGYEGDIPDQDGQYIIVDDNYTSGNTVVPLIELIQSQGGVVPTLSTLAISRYGKSFKPKQAKLDKLLEQTGLTKNEAGSIIGHDLENLTGTEVQILLNATRQGDGAAKLRGLFASRGEGSKAETASDSNSTRRNSSTNRLNQQNRGSIQFPSTDLTDGASLLTIMETADLSTVIHEMGHFYFEVLGHIATQPDAPTQINEDMTTLLDHLGVDSLDAWNAMSTEERRAMHEQTAEEFEHYILEGKAPSSKLRQLFRSLKAWMLSVYRNSVPRLSHINDDVRAVFDRLIASEDEIAAAQQELSANALFTSAEDAGMNDADYAQYLDDIKQTTQLADEALSKRAVGDLKWLEGALGKALKAIQKDAAAKREAMQKEVEADVYSRPVYAAWRYLSRGIVPEGSLMQGKVRLSTAALRDMYGKDEAALWRQIPIRTGKYSMVSKDGIHPDEIAPIFGFDSGDALVRALVEADKPGNVIKAETNRRMLERYGDLVDENAQREAAMESLHNQHSAKVLRAEYAALNKQVGRRDSLTRAALRDYAEAAIGGIKIMDLRPNDYLRAERKAARATAAAFGKGDIAEAAKQKRIQMIQQALYSQAVQTKNASERHVNYLKTFNSPGTRKKIDPDYMDQIDTFLEAFDLRKSVSNKAIRKRQALNVWLDQQKEQGLEPDFNEAILAKKQHYKTLTADELRGVRDAVKQIHHFGEMKHQLLMMEDKRQFDAVVDDAVASIESHAKRTIEPSVNEKRLRDSSKKFVREAIFGHRKFSSLIRQLDGYVDGGAMWQLFTRSANERNAKEILANRDAGEIILGLMKPYLGLKDKSLTALDSIMRGYSPLESKLAKKLFIPAIGKSLTLEERIAVTLTWGAEVNRERVRAGGFTSIGAMRDEQVQAIIDTLGEEDIHFVKGIWKMMQDKWPDMVQLEKDVSGLTPEQKRSAEIHTKFGKLDGGYYPIMFADEKSEMQNLADMLKDQKRGIYMKSQTKQGHLKATVDGEVQRPLRIDLGVITKHMAQVNHDLAWRKWGLDASRLLRSQRMRQAIASHYSNEFLHEIDEAVKDTIMGDVPAITWSDKALSHVRNGASISAMGLSLATAAVQPLGLLQSASRIGGKYMWQGTREYMAGHESMKATAKRVFEASEVMRTRESSMTREVNDVINEAARNGTLTNVKTSYFWLIGKTQIYTVDIPTWLGAYQKALDGEFDVDTAVALADQAVLDAQTGGNIKDLARVQRGGPLLKLFTNFYSYFNGTLNLTAEVYHRTNFKDPASVGAMVVDYVLLFTAPAILATVIFAALRGDGEDDDGMLVWLAKMHISYMANLFVGVREISGAIEGGYGYSGPAGLRVFGDASNLITQVAQGEPDRAAAKALLKTAGVVFHFPTSQVIRTAEGIEAYAKGEAPITSIAFGKPRNN